MKLYITFGHDEGLSWVQGTPLFASNTEHDALKTTVGVDFAHATVVAIDMKVGDGTVIHTEYHPPAPFDENGNRLDDERIPGMPYPR